MSDRKEQSAEGLYDLAGAGDELLLEAAGSAAAHAARTLLHEPELRVVLIAMAPGGHIKEHKARSATSIQVLRGAIEVQLPERSVEVSAGGLLILEGGLDHAVSASEEAVFLLTLGRPA